MSSETIVLIIANLIFFSILNLVFNSVYHRLLYYGYFCTIRDNIQIKLCNIVYNEDTIIAKEYNINYNDALYFLNILRDDDNSKNIIQFLSPSNNYYNYSLFNYLLYKNIDNFFENKLFKKHKFIENNYTELEKILINDNNGLITKLHDELQTTIGSYLILKNKLFLIFYIIGLLFYIIKMKINKDIINSYNKWLLNKINLKIDLKYFLKEASK